MDRSIYIISSLIYCIACVCLASPFVARHGRTLMLVRLHKVVRMYVCSSYSTFKLVLSVSTDELKCECDEIKANALQDWPSRAENSARDNQPVDGGIKCPQAIKQKMVLY